MNTSCVAGLITIPQASHPVFPACFQGAREWTRGHLRCDAYTDRGYTLRSLQRDYVECASAPRPSFPRKGNRCAA